MARVRSSHIRSKLQKAASLEHVAHCHASQSNKENNSIIESEHYPKSPDSNQAIREVKRHLQNTQHKVRRLQTKGERKDDAFAVLAEKESHSATLLLGMQMQRDRALLERNTAKEELIGQQGVCQHLAEELSAEKKKRRGVVAALIKQLKRNCAKRDRVIEDARKRAGMDPSPLKFMERKSFSFTSRKLFRKIVAIGGARRQAGKLLSDILGEVGIKVKIASGRTVGRAVLEGHVAARIQLGYEISKSKGLTLSADSTSNRGVNFEAAHLAMRVPNYRSGDPLLPVDTSSVPQLRLLGIESKADQTAEGAVSGLMKNVDETIDTFNRSPCGLATQKVLKIQDFLSALKGMNGDHASKEKSAARGIAELKHQSAVVDLGDKKLLTMEKAALVKYLQTWNTKKLVDAGGIEAWNSLSPLEQAQHDHKLMEEIVTTLGKEEYDLLSPEDRRPLDNFIWAGCCMHKEANSFKGGNVEMMREWAKLGVKPPILLANKANAATLRKILDPAGSSTAVVSEDEQRAMEQSTRGGVKMMALAGAILNNKDDKKGQGDRHSQYFQEKVDPHYTHFADVSNTRFGSYGDGSVDFIRYLQPHRDFMDLIRLSKQSGTLTQIEHNVHQALYDPATLMELCAMALYTQAVSKPYMATVRGPETDNVLDLGPLHKLVKEFVTKIVEEPDLLLSPQASYLDATLDGQEWENPEAIKAIFDLMPSLPQLREITVAFFRGTLVTWERFSAEFAPGGLIDQATADERQLAWMPPTNDVNEGALGAYRVVIRGKPSMTLHQYNAHAMFKHNNTQEFMDAVFTLADYDFVMKEARHMDASHLESSRRKEIVDFRVKVAEIRKEKELVRKGKLQADAERLSKVVVITNSAAIGQLTLPKLGEQIDTMRFNGLPDVHAKSRYSKKAERVKYVRELAVRYTAHLSQAVVSPPSPRVTIELNWEAEEEAEMDE